uniref:Uncharacterized protein ycf35 n=1 Tax=Riquetophycus sp. TaxID=1897556 RepID=A0A1C9C880_9FLOR|nr:hypothetical protein Riqu_111 [Riquetophycus sp.]
MSHLSQIKTRINNTKVLEQTLNDLGFQYNFKIPNKLDINVVNNTSDEFEFIWDGQEYSLVADIQTWKSNLDLDHLINQIIQQYSYNSIMEESTKYGFTNISETLMQDGSIKLIVQRWN